MSRLVKMNPSDWTELLDRIRREIKSLSGGERTWLAKRVRAIATIQKALDELFCKVGGPAFCSSCDETCCGCGRHHVTLTNLFAYLLEDEDPPTPDFSVTCPYLGDRGCLLPASRRPYNCITFFCEILDNQLDPADRERLRLLDGQLRAEYQRIAEHYPAATLRGLWVALERAGDDQLLRLARPDVIE